MRIEPKPFQLAAISAALNAFADPTRSRRFLVADEVGLGKTVVARGVVEGMAAGKARPLSVFYVCSNLSLARQNLQRLAGFLPEQERASAIATVDRPSLMPTRALPSHPRLRLFSLSPATALPGNRGGNLGGRVEERALAAVLLDAILPERPRGLHAALRLAASKETFLGWFRYYEERLARRELGVTGFVGEFRDALRRAFNLEQGQHLPPRIHDMLGEPTKLAALLRSALAAAALSAVRPDLVILDEFQRFRDLLDPDAVEADEAAARVLEAIRGGGPGGPALLLLSATPYVPYRGSSEGGGAEAASDFHNLVAFLAGGNGDTVRASVKRGFIAMGEELRKGLPDLARVAAIRTSLEAVLRPLMCRTERSRISPDAQPIRAEHVDLHPADVGAFRNFARCLLPNHGDWAVPLWSSVPLPMQTLGVRYQAWAGADWKHAAPAIALRQEQRDDLQSIEPLPHPRLRALLKAMPPRRLALPWVAPSLPWWPLGGGWAGAQPTIDGKLLVFSRYRATPAAVAGLLSYAVETAGRGRRAPRAGGWQAATERSLLPANPERPGLLALFHPSPLLVELDPLKSRRPGDLALRQAMLSQLRQKLSRLGVAVVARSPRSRSLPGWQVIAALEARAGLWPASKAAWKCVAAETRGDDASGGRLDAMLERWDDASKTDVSVLSEGEVQAVAQLGLDAPGVVMARAISRHWSDAMADGLSHVTSLSWRGLRAYLDNPWFAKALGGSGAERYPDALRAAVRDGNLEAVLDEHLWYISQAGVGDWPERIADLSRALRLRTGNATLHQTEKSSFRLRCHAAAAMTDARLITASGDPDRDGQLRPEEVRHAFNSPFWPHVLITTSVGQEGLDFHPWCRAVAHWDLPAGPVALEQREGRVTRHAGLSVRRALAKLHAAKRSEGGSPWVSLARHAEAEYSDATGLSPWWIAPGASVQRMLFSVPGSEIEERMAALSHERAIYRIALGMPDQADLIGLLTSRTGGAALDTEAVCVNLMAFSTATPATASGGRLAPAGVQEMPVR